MINKDSKNTFKIVGKILANRAIVLYIRCINDVSMKIPVELMEKWQTLKTVGDQRKIAEANDINESEISRAFVKGECNDDVFVMIANFYKEKEELIRSYLNDPKVA